MGNNIYGKHCFSIDGEGYSGAYATREEALTAGKTHAVNLGIDTFYIGVITEAFKPSIDADYVLETVVEDAIDRCGEYVQDYLLDVSPEDVQELQIGLNEFLTNWIDKHNYYPDFYNVESEEEIYIGELDENLE